MCLVLYMIFVEVLEHHPQVPSLQLFCMEGSHKGSRMKNIREGITFWPSALLQPRKGEGARHAKHLQTSQERKLSMQKPYPKLLEANGKHIWWNGQKIKYIKTFWVKLLKWKSISYHYLHIQTDIDTGSNCLIFRNFPVCSPVSSEKASFRCM